MFLLFQCKCYPNFNPFTVCDLWLYDNEFSFPHCYDQQCGMLLLQIIYLKVMEILQSVYSAPQRKCIFHIIATYDVPGCAVYLYSLFACCTYILFCLNEADIMAHFKMFPCAL